MNEYSQFNKEYHTQYIEGKISLNELREKYGLKPIEEPAANERLILLNEKYDNSDLSKFYFTFGTAKYFPFQKGYLIVLADNLRDAIRMFREHHPDYHEGVLNCSDYYTELQFERSGMANGSWGGCHEVLTYKHKEGS